MAVYQFLLSFASPLNFLSVSVSFCVKSLFLVRLPLSVARWFLFKPKKIPICVNFGGSCNGRCWYILCPFGQFSGHSTYFMAIWYNFVIFSPVLVHFFLFWYVVPKKSGNPAVPLSPSLSVQLWSKFPVTLNEMRRRWDNKLKLISKVLLHHTCQGPIRWTHRIFVGKHSYQKSVTLLCKHVCMCKNTPRWGASVSH
jgi:hypothetical protein